MKNRKAQKNRGLKKQKMQVPQKIFAVVLVSTMATGNFSAALLAETTGNKNMNETRTVADINRLMGNQSLSSELRNEYRVKVECGANGTASPYEERVVKKGEDLTLELIPDGGYEVSIIKLNGVEASLEDLVNNEKNNSEYTIKNIEDNLIVYVEFKAKEATPETYAKPRYNAASSNPGGGVTMLV